MECVRRLAYPCLGLAALVVVPACGQSLDKPPANVSASDGSVSGADGGGSVGSKDLAAADAAPSAIIDMAGFNQAGAPVIVISEPTAGAEVHYDTLEVTATITSPSNSVIKADSVQVTVTPPGGAVVSAPLTLTTVANVYKGSVSLPDNLSGDRTFTVTASDLNGLKGSTQGTFVHDHGAVINFVSPSTTTRVKGNGQLTVEFTVDDSLHPITDLSKVSAGIRALGDITLMAVANANPFTVFATVDLKTIANPALDGSQLVKAQVVNTFTTTKATQPFIVDNQGPTIKISLPQSSQTPFVSGVTLIQADIDDPSGVDDSTVVAVWGGNPAAFSVPLTRPSTMSTTYTGSFDVRSLGTSYVQPVLSVRAQDSRGNQSEAVDSFFVDNTRPWLTMDPTLQVRIAQLDEATHKEACSALFPPLGPVPEVAHDGATTQLAITLRARVEDHGNTEPGLVLAHASGIDLTAASVVLYVIADDGATPLAVDTDNDGVCDDVNPLLVPTTNIVLPGEALSVPLTPIFGAGAADFTLTNAQAAGPCDEFGEAGAPVFTNAGICDTTGLIFNIGTLTNQAEIFTLPPAASGPLTCVGTQLDSYNHNLRGPICVLTRAVDKSGNINVSYPLHLCVIDPANPSNCNSYTSNTTNCTGVWNKVTQQLGSGLCTAPAAGATFSSGEVIKTL